MRRLNRLGGHTGLVVGVLGIACSMAQGCANGDTKQGDASGNTGGIAAGTGGDNSSSQGGTTANQQTSNLGGTTSTTGGAALGGNGNGQGGANTGGVVNAGGTKLGASTGGGTSDTGGAGVGGTTSGTGGIATGGVATGGMPAITCKTSLDCASAPNSQTVCDTSAGDCVQCTTADDCTANPSFGPNHDCTADKCIAYTPCADADAGDPCPNGGVCDTATQRCVGCAQDADCPSGKCLANTCRVACSSDLSCTSSGLLCNKDLGVCVQCGAVNQADCSSGLVCDATGQCVAPVCSPGDERCGSDGIEFCLSNGSGFGNAITCPAASSCQAQGGVAACYDADGGVVYNCAKQAGDPCTQIPKFTGVQVLDGNGDEMCVLPAAPLDATHNQGIIKYNAIPPEVASIRVGWSNDGLHVFVSVIDASVQTVSMVSTDLNTELNRVYQGDSIELMITSTATGLDGNTADDTSSLHVQIPAQGPATSVKSKSSGGTPSQLPSKQFAQKLTSTGYAIEALLPWPGQAPAANANVRFDMTLNSADKNFGSINDMRDGVLIYHISNVAQTTCPSMSAPDVPIEPWCDDRSWCATPLK